VTNAQQCGYRAIIIIIIIIIMQTPVAFTKRRGGRLRNLTGAAAWNTRWVLFLGATLKSMIPHTTNSMEVAYSCFPFVIQFRGLYFEQCVQKHT
jgi:hypothetical protein